MRNRYICEFCKGRLDPGEKCDCQKMQNRNYTSIEGAGYKPVSIGQSVITIKNRLNKSAGVDRGGPCPACAN